MFQSIRYVTGIQRSPSFFKTSLNEISSPSLWQKNKLSILDFGAGSGTNIKILTKLGSVDVYEVNPKMRSFLKTKFKKKSNVRIISKITKKYNLILAADVIEHIKNDKHVINNFYKFLAYQFFLLLYLYYYLLILQSIH